MIGRVTITEFERRAKDLPKLGCIWSAENDENLLRVGSALIAAKSAVARAELIDGGRIYAAAVAYCASRDGCAGRIYQLKALSKGGNLVILGEAWAG